MKHSLKRFLTSVLCLGVIGIPLAADAAPVTVDVTKLPSYKVQPEQLELEKKWDKVLYKFPIYSIKSFELT